MFRLIFFVLMIALPAGAQVPIAPPFLPAATFTPAGPARAAGVLVWLQGGVSPGQFPNGQPLPGWIARVATAGWDIWRFDRIAGQDPLAGGAEGLIRGLEGLRAAGYRRIVVAGFSRGAFIAMAALGRPDLVEAVALLSPAAHGTRPERRAQAMADFSTRLGAARGPMRFALAQFNDDPFDADPEGRGRMAREAAQRERMIFFHIDCPPEPTGHMASFEPEFDAQYGELLVGFLLGGR